MLTCSLCCFRGISTGAERKLWRAGCLGWDCLPWAGQVLSPRKAADLAAQLPVLRAALDGGVADVFLQRLPVGHRLRVWPDFASGTTFLDVETTGLALRDELTVIGAYRDGCLRTFVRGRNLEDFLRIWRQTSVLVSFNGARFDWPILARAFGLTSLPPHIDLLVEARAFGYAGGLKAIERAIGIRRSSDETGDGERAVHLWRQFEDEGNEASLRHLLRYNSQDVRSLVVLARELLRRSMDSYPGPRPAVPPLSLPGGKWDEGTLLTP
ncbi:MAG: ribonuclease H-like domain-containing protein [Acidobacteria bacterium]|nr:ribonuclease H-like domain-containing protein [Acidobacteriota bacterium]